MKITLLSIILYFNFTAAALAFCPNGFMCPHSKLFVSTSNIISPKIINKIQSIYKGRVLRVTPDPYGNNIIQLLTIHKNVIIVIVDSKGNVMKVRR